MIETQKDSDEHHFHKLAAPHVSVTAFIEATGPNGAYSGRTSIGLIPGLMPRQVWTWLSVWALHGLSCSKHLSFCWKASCCGRGTPRKINTITTYHSVENFPSASGSQVLPDLHPRLTREQRPAPSSMGSCTQFSQRRHKATELRAPLTHILSELAKCAFLPGSASMEPKPRLIHSEM